MYCALLKEISTSLTISFTASYILYMHVVVKEIIVGEVEIHVLTVVNNEEILNFSCF